MMPLKDIYLIRHGETKWALTGQHTGVTDLPLLESGKKQAVLLEKRLKNEKFTKVFSSPLIRAKETCILAGFNPEIEPLIAEWNYGQYEGLTTAEITAKSPGWNLFKQGALGGESPEDVKKRLSLFIAKLESMDGKVAIFSSAHILRAFTALWLHLPLTVGSHLLLSPGSLSVLGYENKERVINLWNDISHL